MKAVMQNGGDYFILQEGDKFYLVDLFRGVSMEGDPIQLTKGGGFEPVRSLTAKEQAEIDAALQKRIDNPARPRR